MLKTGSWKFLDINGCDKMNFYFDDDEQFHFHWRWIVWSRYWKWHWLNTIIVIGQECPLAWPPPWPGGGCWSLPNVFWPNLLRKTSTLAAALHLPPPPPPPSLSAPRDTGRERERVLNGPTSSGNFLVLKSSLISCSRLPAFFLLIIIIALSNQD